MIEGFEWFVLLAIVLLLLFFGPTKIPELARGIGRAWGELRRGQAESEREAARLESELADGRRAR